MHNSFPFEKQHKAQAVPALSQKLIGNLLAENICLREQIAELVLETASLREELENWQNRH